MALRDWHRHTPGVEAVRPGRCPACGAASRPVGEPLGLVGHGLRERQVLGPVAPDGEPRALTIGLRRFRCRSCAAVCTVGPPELVAGRGYSGAAILLALALWGHVAKRAADVRRLVSPHRRVGEAAAGGWASLRRWVRSGPWPAPAAGTWRERALRLVAALLHRSPVDPAHASVAERAFAAAAHAGRGPSC